MQGGKIVSSFSMVGFGISLCINIVISFQTHTRDNQQCRWHWSIMSFDAKKIVYMGT